MRGQLALALLACCTLAGPSRAAGRPNILLIVTDDHHYQGYHAVGHPGLHTPCLDRLAAGGVMFRQATAACPQCVPSRGALLTGLFPHQNGLLDNANRLPGGRFEEPTVIERLRRSGYHTAVIGKWHVRPRPWECGFEEVRLWLPGGSSRYDDPRLAHGNDPTLTERPGLITRLFSDDAIAFLGNQRKEPFFLWLAYNAPHSPLKADPQFRALYAGKSAPDLVPPGHAPTDSKKPFDWPLYAAVISQLDKEIGRVVQALHDNGLAENTLVIVVGDNGWMGGAHGHTGKVLPYEDSIRVPMLVSGFGVKAGSVSDAIVSTVDLAPTWLDLAGEPVPTRLPGRSLRPLLAGQANDWRSDILVEMAGDFAAYGPVDPYRLVRTARYKFVSHRSGKPLLFDLEQDPHEANNRAGDPAVAAVESDLRGRLARWLERTGDDPDHWLARPQPGGGP